jgi:hypothetical protein
MPIWSVQRAKARFSELLDTCVNQGPQVVTDSSRVLSMDGPAFRCWAR